MLVFLAVAVLGMSACTSNTKARAYGGTMTVDLPVGEKLVTATWKEANLWYLTRPMRSGEVPENYTFKEKSALGMIEGKVILNESVGK